MKTLKQSRRRRPAGNITKKRFDEWLQGALSTTAIVKALPGNRGKRLADYCKKHKWDLPAFVAVAMETAMESCTDDPDGVAACYRAQIEELKSECAKGAR